MTPFGVKLAVRLGVGKGRQSETGRFDGEQAGPAEFNSKAARLTHLGQKADIGQRRPVPERERTRLAFDKGFQRLRDLEVLQPVPWH